MKLNADDIRWIEGVLSNDENSTDEELLAYFQQNGLSAQQATDVVAHRDTYLNDIVSDGAGPLWEAC
ncbi:hypothetical protein [Pseudoxanthomonas daejeonensis]|uniref:Uncharacterized protein n=1 Tax=Pseudoxanthomonas daejeonensis TaxID=266062 RepID=A0ABQ6Z947_9GAMM|nr:hypothetical protein [Pseudoxanthomonas daejeonensis]KAF1696006.1 hypothetical protein CSC65_05785 [Pseudoxanthomonas daejeonensis]